MSALVADMGNRVRGGIPWWIGLILLAGLFVLPNLMAAKLSKLWLQLPGLDKPTHFLAFVMTFLLVYSILLGRAWPENVRNRLWLAVGISLGISVVDEVQQAMLGIGRSAEYGDLVADIAGILVGVVCVNVGRIGFKQAIAFVAVLLIPVAAVTVQTHHDLNHYHRGMVYEREHDYVRARTEYQLALDSGFQSAGLYNAIAWLDIEFLATDPTQVVGYAAQAYELDRNNPDILDTYGWVLVKAGRPREGLPLIERAKEIKPDMYCIDLHLGVAYREVGDSGHAIEYLKRQIKRNVADRWGVSAKRVLEEMERTQG